MGRNECEAQTENFYGPIYKKFWNRTEAEEFTNGILPEELRLLDGEEHDVVFVQGPGSKNTVAGIGVWWGKDVRAIERSMSLILTC
jgi:hypothetical protein